MVTEPVPELRPSAHGQRVWYEAGCAPNGRPHRRIWPTEPACWSWHVPAVPTAEETARLIDMWGRRFWTAEYRQTPDIVAQGCRFAMFHGGRCAMCGTIDATLVADHDHQSGVLRGYLCGGCNAGEGSRGNASRMSFVGYRHSHPAVLLNYRERYNAGGIARSFVNARFQLLARKEREIEAVQVSLDTVCRQMVRTGRPKMLDFAGRIEKVWGQVGAVLGPAVLAEYVLEHIERLRFYLDIVEDEAALELSAWDWLVGRSASVAAHALIDLQRIVSAT